MHIEAVREYCLAKKGTTEEFPFDETTLVFKVMGKMYVKLGNLRNKNKIYIDHTSVFILKPRRITKSSSEKVDL